MMENVRQFLRNNGLSNRVFTDDNDIVGYYCFCWNRLTEMPWRIMSLGLRDRARGFRTVEVDMHQPRSRAAGILLGPEPRDLPVE